MVTPTKDPHYPELEKLVKEIKQGKRIILHPVGGISFIAVIMLLLASVVMLVAPLIDVIGRDWEIGAKGNAQMFSLLLGMLCIVLPGLIVSRGKKELRGWFIFFSTFLAFSAAISIAVISLFNIKISQLELIILSISLIAASLAALLAQSAKYRAFTYFYFFLHRKD